MTRKMLMIFSLIGLVVSVWLWARSYGTVYINTFGHNSSGHKTLMLYRGKVSFIKSGPAPAGVMPGPSPVIWTIRAPMWPIAVLFAVALPGIELAHRLRRHRRRKMGQCIKCGYDLRGSEDRCPECGTPFDEAATGPQRFIWVRRTGSAAAWGKGAGVSSFAVLVAGMSYVFDGQARRDLEGDLISFVSAKTSLAENAAIPVIIALIVTLSFACSRLLYARIAFRRVPDLRNADSPLVESPAGKKNTPQRKGKTAFGLSRHWARRSVR